MRVVFVVENFGRLIFTNNIFLYLLGFLFLPILLFYKGKVFKNKKYNEEFLSRTTTDCMKGLAILVVMIHHISLIMEKPAYMKPYMMFGYLAVTIFFLFSGYGLAVSIVKKRNYLQGFFSKRLSKVYIPFVIINVVTILLASFSQGSYNIFQILIYALGIKLIDSTLWFIQTIILFYGVYYFAFSILPKNFAAHSILIFAFFYFIACHKVGLGGWIYNTSFCFPIGVYMGLYYDKLYKFMKERYFAIAVLSIISFVATFHLGNLVQSSYQVFFATASSVCFIFVTLIFLMKVKIKSEPLRLLGIISYEMYLVHMKVFIIYFNFVRLSESYSTYIYIALVVLVAVLFNKLFNIISVLINRIQVISLEETEK
ncbi:acyltransferase 3 [Clostridium cellulovorans 743B]|uniref:Acyltransferase 3 n=2 Tax=Clostridium cellulovorans TaxID=1493 RepID=D9SWN7_CLOC7|nr:acyltransferase 3 [Clostridium cellulovorans 743B]